MFQLLKQLKRTARRNRREIQGALRQAVALLLIFAMPGATLPIDAGAGNYRRHFGAARNSAQDFLPIGGLGSLAKTAPNVAISSAPREAAKPAAASSNPPLSLPSALTFAAPGPSPKVPPTGPTVTFVQQAAVRGDPGVSNTLSLAFGSPGTSGNLIVVGVKWGDQTISVSSITDNKGNTYTSAVGPTNWSGTAKRAQTFYSKDIVGGGAPITITVTLSATPTSSFYIYQLEYADADLVSPVDVTSAATGTSVSLTSGSATTHYANDLVYGFAIADSGTLTAGSGFTARSTLNGNLVEDKTVSSAQSTSATATNSISSNWFMQMVAFRVGGNGGSAPSITSINPTSGAVGSSVTVTGTNFGTSQGNSLVTFNGQTATATSWSTTGIVAVVPTGATTGDIKVNVGGLLSNGKDFTVTGGGANPPIANAGPAQTVPVTTQVQLDGTGSTDPLGKPLTYQWTFTAIPTGSAATLTNPTSARPTLVADKTGNYTAQLIVNDGTLSSTPATVIISTTNSTPIANAGPSQTVPVSSTVHLDGRGSTDVDGDPLTYAWTITNKPSGSTAILSNPAPVNPTFVADLAGSYTAQLVVSDGHTASALSQTFISTTNSAPVANAGPNQLVIVGTTVQLDGSRSTDVDGNPLTYAWAILSKPSSSAAVLSSGTAVNPSFVADANGTYVVQLIVSDGTVNSTPATVTIATDNIAPVANAGPDQTVAVAAFVTLDGSRSTAVNSRPLSYRWAILTKPSGSNAALSGSLNINPTFTADVSGTYVIQLIVNDGFFYSAPSTVVISTVHSRPVANAGPNQFVAQNSTVTLNGTGSYSPDHSSLTYTWAILSQPTGAGATLSNPHVVSPTFAANSLGVYVAQLIVNDGMLNSFPSTVEINALTPQPPIVSAGTNASIELPTNTYGLQGSVTAGWAGGHPTSLWTEVSGPGTVTFASATSPVTTATFPGVGSFVLKLTGTDGTLSNNATVTITVLAINKPPVVSAGPDQSIQLPTQTVNLAGSATDDGLPPNGGLTYLWSKDSGPGTVTFGNTAAAATTATLSVPGVYFLRLSVSDTQLTGTAAARITLLPAHTAPTVSAGNNQIITLPVNSVTLNGSVTGHGLPAGAVLTSTWSFVSGPGSVSFANANSPVTTATFSAVGTYDLRLAANDGTLASSADVTIVLNLASFPQALVLTPQVAGPDVTEASQTMAALLTDSNGAPVANTVVQFVVGGANAITGTGTTGANGVATFSYTGYESGLDTVTATALAGGFQIGSNSSTVNWVRPIQPVSSTPITGMFFTSLCEGYFCTPPTQQPVFTQNFPTINFDPPVGTVPGNTTGVDIITRPFTDVVTDLNGNSIGTIVAQGNGVQAGVGTLFEFQAVFTGTFLVRVPGIYTVRIFNDDGMFFGIGNGATRVSGPMLYNVPPSGLTPFNNYPIMGSYNTGTGAVGFDYVVNFPTPGSYPYEVDYSEAFGQGLCLTMALVQGNAASGVPPATSITLTPNTPQTLNIGNQIAVTALVQDASGAVVSYKPIVFSLSGTNNSQVQSTTDVNGRATFTYTSLVAGIDRIQATAPILGITGYSNEVNLTWNVVGNQPPVITIGPNQTVNLPNAATLSAMVTDDGLPNGTLTMGWTQASGPAAANILSPAQRVTQVTFPQTGTYVFTLTASDSVLTTSASVTVTVQPQVNQPPVVNAGSGQTIQLPQTTVTLNGSATDDGLPNGTLTIAWSKLSGPATVTFSSPSTAVTQATFSTAGTYTLQLSANDSALTTTSTVTITVLPALGPPPTVAILTPADGAEVTAPTQVTGNVSGGSWQLAYSLVDDFNPQPFVTFAMGSGAVTGGALGSLDPSLLLNGTYQIQLTTTAADGQFATATSTVNVTRNMKVGVFTLSFNDLTVPMAGLPIQITRTYDSRDKGQGDFGIGWRLSMSNARLQKNHSIGLAWQETVTINNSGFPQYCLQPTSGKTVTITFPDGKVYRFQATTSQPCQSFGPITVPTVTFTQIQGTSGTNGATLVAADGGAAIVDGPVPGPLNLVGYDGNTYNPTAFKLATAQGFSYAIDQKLGITSLTDPNGNTLTFTANGILHSSGKSVTFVRDAQGRVMRITDPDGNPLVYAYNSSGDLASFDDRTNNLTTYAYGANHYLLSITTPDGRTALTNSYDANGRLIGTADAFNSSVGFTHDIPNQRETVTNRLANSTVYTYDADGNVIQVTDALGNVTSSTYDTDDNKLTETNGLGKTSSYTYDTLDNRLTETDPLGHKTSYTYNQFQQPLTITDPLNHATTNTYDGNGNLLTTIDPLGKVTTNTYSTTGLLVTTKDPLGKTTSFGYDGSGNLTQQTDANNTVTSYSYDANGNRQSQSVTRTLSDGVTHQTLTTNYAYDGNNHLTKTTYPDGSTSQVVYNTLGQQANTIDALGRSTSYSYDADGHLTLTTYPDAKTDVSVYDAEGHRTQSNSRGIITNYVYDKVGRLTQTIAAADNATTTTAYDAAGQVQSTTDALNHTTSYAYDDAGRRTSVTDALTHVITFTYDNAGNQLSVKDANNHTTNYIYDNANRRTQVTYPDSKFETTTYDALGRVIARTDAAGKTTQYGYDNLGRLTSVTDALNQVTAYGYDEVGNRLTQTDANNHTTSYSYDQRGRRLQRKLPLGQTESYTYDAAGNLATRTDFNGRTTTYAYDAMNRLLSKTADAYFAQNHIGAAAVNFSYTATGKRATMSDASGVTTYHYDARDRVSAKLTPGGSVGYDQYDLASNLTQLTARAVGPSFAVYYGYDALNRMVQAYRGNLGVFSTLSYDAVGNLQTVNYPNGVVHSYTYDTRNRLTNLGIAGTVNGAPGAIASYAYTLDAAGHRTGVTELSGRTVSYAYDNLYRLTNETIASDPSGMNGSVTYTYDPVGNRTQKVSTLPGYPGGLTNYNANDQLASDTYDNDGNTTASNGVGYVYDFENRLVQAGAGISIVYDGDGNRVSKTVAGVTTTYLVADQNPTGYAQVIEEDDSTGAARQYTYGLELISRWDTNTGLSIYYVHDGHGSVRALTNQTGAVTDTYDYDAFGNLIHSTGTTPNNYLFAGEQFDPDLGLYYNRARYLSVSTGRFWSMDTYEGFSQDSLTLHKYLFAGDDPVNRVDRSGRDYLTTITAAAIVTGLSSYGLSVALRSVGFSSAADHVEGLGRIANGVAFISSAPSYGAVAPPLAYAAVLAGVDEIMVGGDQLINGGHPASPIEQFLISAGLSQRTAGIVTGSAKAVLSISPRTWGAVFSIQQWARNFRSDVTILENFGEVTDAIRREIGNTTMADEAFNQVKGLDPVGKFEWMAKNPPTGWFSWASLTLGIGKTFGTGPTVGAQAALDIGRFVQNLRQGITQ
jgi:RHS repeat-associated protein